MTNATTKIELPSKEKYILIGWELISRISAKFDLFALSKVTSFSKTACRSKMQEFSSNFHVTERHSSRVINKYLKNKEIERVTDEKGREVRSLYRYVGDDPYVGGSLRIDMFLLETEFIFKGSKKKGIAAHTRYLTLIEVLVLSFMLQHCRNPKTRVFRGSVRSIAKKLHLSTSSVQAAIFWLMNASLISRPEEDKAKNGSGWTTYHANEGLLRKAKKKSESVEQVRTEPEKTVVKYKTAADDAADAKTDRTRFYEKRRKKAKKRADQAKARLDADIEYKEAAREELKLRNPIARAELDGNIKELRRLQELSRQAKRKMRARMETLAISPEDLTPQYFCVKCADTGFHPDGTYCKCYIPGAES
ncbi:MAG: hypothetical protein IJ308_03630 [Clostridia bacterium]|nr:hypothetical protein [Clostridia bacterium]